MLSFGYSQKGSLQLQGLNSGQYVSDYDDVLHYKLACTPWSVVTLRTGSKEKNACNGGWYEENELIERMIDLLFYA